MCTVVVLLRPGHRYPLLIAANRDEHRKRPWDPPGAHWPEQPGTIAGRDRTAGGTWMGVNEAGVVAAVLNRAGTLGPILGKRSRGELPLLALQYATADAAAAAVTRIDAGAWRDFNMVIADRRGALFVRGLGVGNPSAHALPEGVSMVTAYDPNDPASPRVTRHLQRLREGVPEGPENWDGWRRIFADRAGEVGEQINVVPRGDFATVCSSFVTIPESGPLTWLFAPGPPHEAGFYPVVLSGSRAGLGDGRSRNATMPESATAEPFRV